MGLYDKICRVAARTNQTRLRPSTAITAMASSKDEATRLIFAPNVQHNSALYTIKFLSSCFSGAVAGILGLENWRGFTFFIISTLFSALCMYIINCKGHPAKYVSGGVRELVNPGQDNVFSFVLVWTLFYGMWVLDDHFGTYPLRLQFWSPFFESSG